MTLQNPSDCVQRRENSLSSAKFVLFSERLVSARIQKHSVWKSMYPFAFEEFLWATGTYEETISYLRECFINRKPVNEAVYQSMLKAFYAYIVIGGMPEVVKTSSAAMTFTPV